MPTQKYHTLGEHIRLLREGKELPLRKVAAELDMDPSTLGKIERNERNASKDMVIKLAKVFGVNEKELIVSYLSDKIVYEIQKELLGKEALKVAEEKIKYFKNKLK